MGGCASAPIEFKKGRSLPPELPKEESASAAPIAAVEEEEESKHMSLEKLLSLKDEEPDKSEPKKAKKV
ncbi:hypothetical protein SAY87_027464 [Trapa incisa]|uniref:Uncharacterized protein n=1 Tax=Trapa incisa TaxID=236973 RepID=A0AAN7H0W5_9MYRT|nr:hypothetical protein SAY87_027464 [Trapa incisa]